MQLSCRFLVLFWLPLLCATVRHGRRNGLLRGYPIDSPNATWLPVEDEVDESLADTKDEIGTAEKELAYIKKYCNGKNHGRCKRQVERMSARLDRLIAAEKQLREKDEKAKKVEDGVRTSAESVIELENKVNSLHAVKKFAELSKKDFDQQEQRLTQASEEYARKTEQAQSQIDLLEQDLARARRLHYNAEQKSLDLIAKAKGIERGVETPDLYADTEFARSVRKQRVAERLYARADAIREHAEKMMILHHNENKSEVKEVMYGTAHRMITEDQGIVNFGHMSDFGGELPHEDRQRKPCRKVKTKRDDDADDADDELDEENPNAPAAADENPNSPADTDVAAENPNAPGGADAPAEPAQPAAEVKIEPPQKEDQNVKLAGDAWDEVEMKDANDHKDQWVALHHHSTSKKTITQSPKGKMLNNRHSKPEVFKPKTDAVVEKPSVEPSKEQEASKSVEDDDEPQQIFDDESGGDDEVIDVASVPTTTVTTTTTVAVVSVDNDPVEAFASDDQGVEPDEDSPELAEADVDEDSANMDQAEQQFREAEEAEQNLH